MRYNETEHILCGYLDAGERLAWAGRRGAAPRVGCGSVYFGFFTLIAWVCVAGMLVPFFQCVLHEGLAWQYILRWQNLPYVLLLGVFFSIGRWWTRLLWHGHFLEPRNTYYGITNRRALIVIRKPKESVISLPFFRMSEVTLEDRSGDKGTLRFRLKPKSKRHRSRERCFLEVDGVTHAYTTALAQMEVAAVQEKPTAVGAQERR